MHPDAWLRADESDIAHFSASSPTIKLNGGAYKWSDNGDGTKTILDLPLVAKFDKGTKGIQYEGDETALSEIVAYHKDRHSTGKFLPTAFKGHNDPLQKAEMAGFVMPTRVGMAMTQHGEKAALFGNVKVFDAQFDEIKAGKLPYVSPEIHKHQKKITGLALLSTEPPHNEFPMLIPGEQVVDATAKFDAKEDTEDDMTAAEIKALIAEGLTAGLAKFSADQAELTKKVDDLAKKASVPAPDPTKGKPSAMPAQPNDELPSKQEVVKMSSDPEMAAKFSALTAKQAELEAKIAAQEHEKLAAKFMAKVEASLGRKIIPSALREQIASFAADWAPLKDGEAKLDKYIETLKPALKDKPTASFEASATADVTDPVIAKFAKDGADLSDVAKFGAQWDAFDASYHEMCMDAMKTKDVKAAKEAFIKNELMVVAAKRDGKLEPTRR